MKTITFTKHMAPHVTGESRVVPDAVADRMVAAGDARDPRPFPPPDVAPHGTSDAPVLRPHPGRRYLTRKAG